MQVCCSQCTFVTRIDETLLPSCGMEGICPDCRAAIPLGGWQADVSPEQSVPPETSPAELTAEIEEELPPEKGWANLINIIALLMLVDSTFSLISRLPGLTAFLDVNSRLTFHQQAKYLYDTCMSAGFFISVFGLMARKNWARLLIIWLFALGLAEGLYMLLYQYVTIAELERNFEDKFPELKRQQNAKMIGCAVYAFFIFKLTTRAIRARFR